MRSAAATLAVRARDAWPSKIATTDGDHTVCKAGFEVRRAWRNGPRSQGAAGRREARTQGASISGDMDATEDAASRRSGAPLGTQRLFRQALLRGGRNALGR